MGVDLERNSLGIGFPPFTVLCSYGCKSRSILSFVILTTSSQVKPENILINHDGILKLCDFGIVHDLRSVRENVQSGRVRHISWNLGIDLSARWRCALSCFWSSLRCHIHCCWRVQFRPRGLRISQWLRYARDRRSVDEHSATTSTCGDHICAHGYQFEAVAFPNDSPGLHTTAYGEGSPR